MSMVFCRGCAKELHETAQMCPQCGAPQLLMNSNITTSNLRPEGWGNPMAWLIACAPLIGAILGWMISATFHYHGFLLVFVTLAINIFLCDFDAKELSKNGIDSSKLNKMLVPLYLFERAKLMNENLGYPILWCVLFAAHMLSAQ